VAERTDPAVSLRLRRGRAYRLLGPGPVDRLVLADPILRPTRVPPLRYSVLMF